MKPSDKTQKPVTPQFKDVSRFTRYINNLDSRDRQLNPQKRKRKWIAVLSVLAVLYLISFLFPAPELTHQKIETGKIILPADSVKAGKPGRSSLPAFEMPVDSFENLLKQRIHEKLPEKK